MNGEAKELARSSICAAVGVTALYLGSILPGARLSILCAASLGTAFTAIRCRARWALGCYAVTGVLALLLLPEKALALLYLLLPGYYPVIKLRAERFRSFWARWSLKLGVFGAAAAAAALIARLYAPLNVFFSGKAAWMLAAGSLGVFLIYDHVLGLLILFYLRKLSGRTS